MTSKSVTGSALAATVLDRLKPQAAAAYVELSESALAKYRMTGVGPRYLKLGGRVFYRRQDLDAWIESNMVETQTSRAAA